MPATTRPIPRSTKLRTITVGGALILVLAACAGGVDGPVIAGNRTMGGETALIEGTLQIDGHCLYIGRSDAEERYPVIWPNGTGWDAEQSAVRLPDGTLVYAGDTVLGGGGFHDAAALDQYTNDEGQALAQTCDDNTYNEVAVFSSGESIEIQR